jgi:hypothetical protein
MRRGGVIGVVLFVSLAFAPAARACTCASGDPRSSLEHADAAFIGELIERPRSREAGAIRSTGEVVDWRFRVAEVFKGDLGDEVVVRSAISGTSCGLSAAVGKEIGLFLRMERGAWRSGLCNTVEPAELRKAAEPLAAPSGRGDARFLVGTDHGDVRLIALDAQGRVLRYGKGDGLTASIDVCPGGDVVAELVSGLNPEEWWKATVATRDIRSMRVIDEFSVDVSPRDRRGRLYAVRPHEIDCVARRGRSFVVVGSAGTGSRVRVLRIDGRETTVLFDGEGGAIAPLDDRDRVFIAAGSQRNELITVDLRSGERSDVMRVIGKTHQIAVNEAGTHLLGYAGRRTMYVADLRSEEIERATTYGHLRWIDDESFLSLGRRIRVYDLSLELLNTFDDAYPSGVVVDGVFYDASGGRLVSTPGRTGPETEIATLDTQAVGGFAVLTPDPAPSTDDSDRPFVWLVPLAIAVAFFVAAIVLRRRAVRAS